jgi:cell division protease FtsH
MIAMAMGGRVAEEQIFGKDKVTTGAGGGGSSDIGKVTQIAKDMVTKYGMSDELGPIAYGDNEEEVFLGRSITRNQAVSEQTSQKIDAEVKKIVFAGYQKAQKIIADKIDDLHKLAKALMDYETLTFDEISNILYKDIYPSRDSDKSDKDQGTSKKESALGSIGLKPKLT